MARGSNMTPYTVILLLQKCEYFSAFFRGRDMAKEVIWHDTR